MKRILFLMTVGLFLVSTSNAQGVWSLDKCVSYAMENNLTIKQTQLNIEMAKIDKSDAKYSMLPNLNGQSSYNHTYGRAVNPLTNSYVPQDVSSFNFNVSSSVNVFNGFRQINTLKSTEYALEAEGLNLDKLRNDIALSVINAYLNVLYNQDLVEVANEQLGVTRLQLDRAEKNVAVGNITQGDLLNIKSQVAVDELNLTTTQNSLDIAKLDLIQLLDRDPAETFEVERPANVDQLVVSGTANSLNDVYKNAEQNLPDIKLLEYRYKAAERNYAAAKGSLYPRLSLGAGMSSDYADINPTIFSKQITNNFGQYWAFTLNVPIFNGFSARNNVKRANINLASAEINRQNARLTLSKNIQQAIADLKAAQKKYESTTKSNQSLKEAFSYNQQKFDVGLINSVDYNLSKNDLTRSEANVIQAKYELIFRTKLLDFYNGKPLTF